MPVLHSGTFSCTTPKLGIHSGDWIHATFPPFGLGYGLVNTQSGIIELTLFPGTSTIVTSADGSFDVAAAPPGFTPTTGLTLTVTGHGTLGGTDVHSIADVGVASGPATAVLALPDNRSWALLRTDLFRISIAIHEVGHQYVVHDPITNGGFLLAGAYDLVAYWWTIPTVDDCGNRRDEHFQLAGDDPGSPWERLDPLDPDAAPTPAIVSIEPDHGPIAGGTSVTIRGSGFGDACSVEFDGTPATSIVTVTSSEITCVAPAHAAGSINVVVINEDGVTSAAAAYEYEAPIVDVLAIEPSTGIPAGGTSVVITGRGFNAGATVTFGGAAATAVVVVSSERITCTTPAHALGAVDVDITNLDASASTLEDGFTFEAVAPAHVVRYRQPSGASASRVRTETSAPQISLTLGGAGTFKFSAEVEPGGETRVEYQLGGRQLFLGTVTGKLERVDGAERLQVWDTTATDLSHRLSRRKATGSWISTSATTIIAALMAAHAPGFVAIVEGGLDATTVKLDGRQDLWTALGDICKRVGAKMVLYGTTLRVFTDDSGWDPPADVTEDNPDLEWTDPATPVTIEWDYLGIVNSVRVLGAAGLELTVDDADSIAEFDVTEDTIDDDTLTTLEELRAAGQARLDAAARPIPVAKYFTRDAATYIGKTVNISIDRPAIAGAFIIQTVTIDQLDIVGQGKNPRFAVTAKPAAATMRSGDQGLEVLLESVVDLAAAARKQPRLTGDVESEPGGRTTIPASTVTAEQLAGCIPSTKLTSTTTAGAGGAADKLVSFTVDAAGRITGYATDPVPVIKTDGAEPYTANQPMGGNRITGAADPVAAQDYATKSVVDVVGVNLEGAAKAPLAFFRLADAGGLTLVDSARPATPATLNVAATTYRAAHGIGLVLNGTQHGTIAPIDIFRARPFGISFRLKVKNMGAVFQPVILNYATGAGIYLNDDLTLGMYGGNSNLSATPLTDGQTYDLCFFTDATRAFWFVNGVEDTDHTATRGGFPISDVWRVPATPVYLDALFADAFAEFLTTDFISDIVVWVPDATLYDEVIAGDAPIARYRLENQAVTFVDATGHGHDATPPSFTGIERVAGATFDNGLGLKIAASATPGGILASPIALTGAAFSVEFWIIPTDQGAAYQAIAVANGPDTGVYIEPSTGSPHTALGLTFYGQVNQVATIAALVPGRLYHCVFVANGATAKWYINGVDVAVSSSTFPLPANSITINELFDDGTPEKLVADLIDELAFYDVALTAAQIAKHFACSPLAVAGGGGDIRADGSVPFTANESMGGHKLTNLGTPTASTDAATKGYVDAATGTATYEAPLTNGDPVSPAIVFDSTGDVVVVTGIPF